MVPSKPSTWFTDSHIHTPPKCPGLGDSCAQISIVRSIGGESFSLETAPLADHHTGRPHQRQQQLEQAFPKAARECLRRAADAVSQASLALQQAPHSASVNLLRRGDHSPPSCKERSASCRAGQAHGSRASEVTADAASKGRKPKKQRHAPFASASAAAVGPKEWKWPNFLQWKPPRWALWVLRSANPQSYEHAQSSQGLCRGRFKMCSFSWL